MSEEIYSGPSKEYEPESGKGSRAPYSHSTYVDGYYDLDGLKRMLDEIIQVTNETNTITTEKLHKFSLDITKESPLEEAQKIEWPSDLGTPKQSVTFKEYEYLETKNSSSAQYIRKQYKNNINGPMGTIAMDVRDATTIIKKEAEHLKFFINTYLGDIDDSSEYRTLELFQDWAYQALSHARNLRGILEKDAAPTSKIPNSELDQISQEQARGYQVLFRAKINAINSDINKTKEQLDKEFTELTPVYHSRFLGPALQLRLKATKNIENKISGKSFLAEQAKEAVNPLNASFELILGDQIKRNKLFTTKLNNISKRIDAKNDLSGYIKQLEIKGKNLKNPFVEDKLQDHEYKYFDQQIQTTTQKKRFGSSHSYLDDILEDDAHPQYLLLKGGTLYGEISFDDDDNLETENTGPDGEPLPFDGMRPGGPFGHRHLGTDIDGTRQLSALDSLEDGTLAAALVNLEEEIITPDRLRFLGKAASNGTGLVDLEIAWDGSGNYTNQYEIQMVRLTGDSSDSATCLLGHSGSYTANTEDRRMLTVGNDGSSYASETPLLSTDDPNDYEVISADVKPLMEKAFVVIYDSNDNKDIKLNIGARTTTSSTRWRKTATELDVASISTGVQHKVTIETLLDSLVLVGCLDDNEDSDPVPQIKLIGLEYSYSSLPPIATYTMLDSIECYQVAETPTTFYGIDAISIGYNNCFLYAYSYIDGDDYYYYINVGKVYVSEDGTTYDSLRTTYASQERIGTGAELKGIQIKPLNTGRFLVVYGEEGSPNQFNWYASVVTVNSQTATITTVHDPVLLGTYEEILGTPRISMIDATTFFLVFAQEV